MNPAEQYAAESHGELAGFLDHENVWCQVFNPPLAKQGPALFLDRDGVVVEWVAYLHRVEDVRLISGAAETISAANQLGLPVVIITNQAGVGRGYYCWTDFHLVQRAIIAALRADGAGIDGVFACPHHPDASGSYFHPAHPSRKPRAGMLRRAAELMGIDLTRSWIIGDRSEDLLAGRAAGLEGGVLVMTGLGRDYVEAASDLRSPSFAVSVADSIRSIPGLIPLLPDAFRTSARFASDSGGHQNPEKR